jgi:hypothetical protein
MLLTYSDSVIFGNNIAQRTHSHRRYSDGKGIYPLYRRVKQIEMIMFDSTPEHCKLLMWPHSSVLEDFEDVFGS